MAQRRMFSIQIVDTDAFMDMPLSAQALYFHLGMRADDDGFVSNARRIQRLIGAADDDLRILAMKRFILTFDSGIVVIKHWRILNTIRGDRYKPTLYQDEKATLFLKPDGAYTDHPVDGAKALMASTDSMDTTWQPSGNQMEPQVRLGKDRLDKDKLGKDREKDTTKSIPSSLEKVHQCKGGVGENADAFSPTPPEPPVIILPLNDGTGYEVSQEQCQEWAGLYPAVDVIQQFCNMKAWLIANPTRKKTRRGIMRFINGWLSREQDRGGGRQQGRNQSGGAMDDLQALHELFSEEG